MIWLGVGFVCFLALALWIMRLSFKALSYEMLQKNNTQFLTLAKGDLSPLADSLKMIDAHQRELEKNRHGAYSALNQQIEYLRKETQFLAAALRSPPVRGAWGQVHLRRVVELAGLLNHCDFFEQSSHEKEGKLLRPDLIVHLPGNREIVVDAKTPLNAFLEASTAEDDAARKCCLEMHALQLRKHMRELSQKDYWKRLDLSPEFVILFLPAEAFFSEALLMDPSLIEAGAEQNIIVATPTTLIAILRAVAHGWKQEALSKNAEQIARLGQELYERLITLSDHWSKVGKSLTSAIDAYNQAISSLESRVFVTARKLKDHGAAPLLNKELEALDPIDRIARKVDPAICRSSSGVGSEGAKDSSDPNLDKNPPISLETGGLQ